LDLAAAFTRDQRAGFFGVEAAISAGLQIAHFTHIHSGELQQLWVISKVT
jgi:hypothetical protein